MEAFSSSAKLRVKISHNLRALKLALEFTAEGPWTILFGPSGSGKSTILRALSGILQPDDGEAWLGRENQLLFSREDAYFPRPDLRPVRSASQKDRLFPHLTVRENLNFGTGGSPQRETDAAVVHEALRVFRLEPYANRRPAELSGGERQRSSVARAVVSAITYRGTTKALLLLDEPFTGIDRGLRDALIPELRDWLRRCEIPVLSVTHDVGEAFLLGCQVIQIHDGRIVAHGPVHEVLAEERAALLQQLS